MKRDSLIQRSIVFCFHLLVITVPFFFTWVNNELFEFNKMLLTYGITIVIIGLWIGRMVAAKKILWRKTWFDIPLLIFVLSQIASTVFSMHPRTSWLGYYTRFHGGLLSTLTYVALFYAFVANVKASQIKNFIWSTLVAALLASLYAIPEQFGLSFSCTLINGTLDTSCWSEATNPRYRIFGTFGQPNWLAAYVITLLPVGFVVTVNQFIKNKLRFAFLGLAITTSLFLALLFTKSRSGFLGFAVSVLSLGMGTAALLLLDSFKETKKQITEKKSLTVKFSLGLLGLLLTLSALFGTPFSPSLGSVLEKYGAQTTQNTSIAEQAETDLPQQPQPVVNRLEVGGTDSGEIRKIVWQGAFDIWKRYPILGSGVETFAYSYYLDRPVEHNDVSEWDFLYNKAHNEFLNFMATTGAVGVVSYLLLLAFLIFKPLHHAAFSKSDYFSKLYAMAIASGLTALSISNFFGFSTVMVSILLLLLPASYFVLVSEQKELKINTNEQLNLTQLLGLGVIIVGVLISLNQVTTWWHADVAYNTGKQLKDGGQLTQGAEFGRQAVKLSPNEAVFHDQLGQAYAEIAVSLYQQDQATAAALYVQAAETASAATFALNPVHLNFYKTQARLFIVLGNIDPNYYVTALNILRKGQELAPTDPKIWYNIALIEQTLGQTEQAQQTLEQTIALRPNYEQARMTLATLYENEGDYQAAADQYRAVLESIAPSNTIAARKLEIVEASISAQTK